jgi:predicted double-glycine peptidase
LVCLMAARGKPETPRLRHRVGQGLVPVVAALLVAASPGPQAADARRPPRLLPVPIISQATPWTCGAASLMAALIYFGAFDDTESRLDTDLGATPEQGVAPLRIAAEARALGLAADVQTGLTLADLAADLDGGALVIVALQAWPPHPTPDPALGWENGHYVVIVGLDESRVYAMDPSVRTGYAYLPRDELIRRWHDYDVREGRREAYQRLGIVLRGRPALRSYPAEPTRIE